MASRLGNQIDRTMGQRRNMNGAGRGARFVAQRRNGRAVPGKRQLGNREQRRADLRSAFGVRG